jgi:hypothetical protein
MDSQIKMLNLFERITIIKLTEVLGGYVRLVHQDET